jgi:hypothetical protein
METEELLETVEHARGSGQRRIGVTMAIFAACLAVVTLMGHRLHTEEVVLQTQTADGWAYYQAKNTRSQMYAADAKLAELASGQGAALAAAWVEKAKQEGQQADKIRRRRGLLRDRHRPLFNRAAYECRRVLAGLLREHRGRRGARGRRLPSALTIERHVVTAASTPRM